MNDREAFEQSGAGGEFEPPIDWDDPSVAHARRIWQAATTAERERCAKLVEHLDKKHWFSKQAEFSDFLADAIRRGV